MSKALMGVAGIFVLGCVGLNVFATKVDASNLVQRDVAIAAFQQRDGALYGLAQEVVKLREEIDRLKSEKSSK